MDVFIQTTAGSGLWYVRFPKHTLGPFPSQDAALEIKEAIEDAYQEGREEIQTGLRELIGAMAHVGN